MKGKKTEVTYLRQGLVPRDPHTFAGRTKKGMRIISNALFKGICLCILGR